MSKLDELIEELGISFSCSCADNNSHMMDMPLGSSHYKYKISYAGKSFTTPFSQGPALTEQPTCSRVLDCLLSDYSYADYPFDVFCGELGFDTDSRKAEKVYKAVMKQAQEMRRVFGDDVIKKLQQANNDYEE